MSNPIAGLRSPADEVGGIVYFGRMLDKIRLHRAGDLPTDYLPNLGKGFDSRCVHFLRISYQSLVDRVAETAGSDEELLAWVYENGKQPEAQDIELWNSFMTKRGWKDEATEVLVKRKAEAGFGDRAEIETLFQYIDADEGRL